MIAPRRPEAAVARALELVGHGVYQLGTGNMDTPPDGAHDCCGFAICQCYGLHRHRPGFNVGSWASVSDDINVNSAIEDADHRRDLFERTSVPAIGDLIGYPTFRVVGHVMPFIGHIAIVVDLGRAFEWDPLAPDWSLLDVVQCCGPNGRKPGILRSTGYHWAQHDRAWPKPEHRTVLLRVAPRGGWG